MKKNVIKLNENTIRKIVAESVKKVLNEKTNFNYLPQSDAEEISNIDSTVRDYTGEDYSETSDNIDFANAISSVENHLRMAKTNINNLYAGNNGDDLCGFYDNDETDYKYLKYLEKTIDRGLNVLARLRDRMTMRKGGTPNSFI